MADHTEDLVPELTRQSAAMGALAKDPQLFQAAVDAFRAEQSEAFHAVLNKAGILVDCDLVCRWLRVKECVLRCIAICGPPVADLTVKDTPAFAQAVARIAADPKLAQRLADAVDSGKPDAFHAIINELKLQRLCHFICYWICQIRGRLVCEIVCSPVVVRPRPLFGELLVAAQAVAEATKDPRQLDLLIRAGIAQDCTVLQGLIGHGGRCIHICEWICSWHCALNCLTLCRPFPVSADVSVAEMQAFAQACQRLGGTAGALQRLVAAVGAEDANAFGALVKEFKLERFCVQLCHWICFEICRRFCFCVCPPAETIPLFTHVGSYRVDPIWADFNPDGTTAAGTLAFTSTIPLIGILPDGATATAMAYRFQTQQLTPVAGALAPMTAAMIAPTIIGQLEYWEFVGGFWVVHSANYWVNNPDPGTNTVTIHQPGPPLVVSVNKSVAPDGWINVPRENSLFQGGVGRFVPTGGLANLMTPTLTNEAFDLRPAAPPLPVKAGDTVPVAQQSKKPTFKIEFDSRNATTLAAIGSNSRPVIALSNTSYTYNRHPDWAGSPPGPSTVTTAVVSLDIAELIAGGGCNHLRGHIHALFTAYHPYLGTCEVFLQGPGVPPPAAVNPPISALGLAVSPAGGQDFDISTLKPCAYILWLSTTLNLTVGYGKLGGEIDDVIAFCTE